MNSKDSCMNLRDLETAWVGVWGMAREGASALKILRRLYPSKPVVVLNDAPLTPEQDAIAKFHDNCRVVTGAGIQEALRQLDVVIRSAGVSVYREDIQNAIANGVVFTSGTQLWFEEPRNSPTIVVTGTKGKTTTTHLIRHLLAAHGLRVVMAGNLGSPLLDHIEVADEPDVWVIELSSHQLTDANIHPHIAVVLNLYPEHLDWHGGEENYFRDKLNALKNIRPGCAVLNWRDPNTRRLTAGIKEPAFFNHPQRIHSREGGIWDGEDFVLPRRELSLPGEHNASNFCAALTAVKILGIPPSAVASSVSSFRGIPHRLQALGEVGDILCVDDSISTIPESTIAALEVYKDRDVTLLVGGHDRGLDYAKLIDYLVSYGCTVITIPDSGARIAEGLRTALAANSGGTSVHQTDSLEQAVALARQVTPRGGVILLSPAAPSYGRFTNYEERGNCFRSLCGLACTNA